MRIANCELRIVRRPPPAARQAKHGITEPKRRRFEDRLAAAARERGWNLVWW
jgi:hypothetical protein